MTSYEVKPWPMSMRKTQAYLESSPPSVVQWRNMHRRLRSCFPFAEPFFPLRPAEAVALLKSKGFMERAP